jgi:hypothetical protein
MVAVLVDTRNPVTAENGKKWMGLNRRTAGGIPDSMPCKKNRPPVIFLLTHKKLSIYLIVSNIWPIQTDPSCGFNPNAGFFILLVPSRLHAKHTTA